MMVYNCFRNDLRVFASTILPGSLALYFNNSLYEKTFLDICLNVICLYIPFNLFVLLVVMLDGKNNKMTNISTQYLVFTESFNKIPFICIMQFKNKQRFTLSSFGFMLHALD